jgi:hypothetical protein
MKRPGHHWAVRLFVDDGVSWSACFNQARLKKHGKDSKLSKKSGRMFSFSGKGLF